MKNSQPNFDVRLVSTADGVHTCQTLLRVGALFPDGMVASIEMLLDFTIPATEESQAALQLQLFKAVRLLYRNAARICHARAKQIGYSEFIASRHLEIAQINGETNAHCEPQGIDVSQMLFTEISCDSLPGGLPISSTDEGVKVPGETLCTIPNAEVRRISDGYYCASFEEFSACSLDGFDGRVRGVHVFFRADEEKLVSEFGDLGRFAANLLLPALDSSLRNYCARSPIIVCSCEFMGWPLQEAVQAWVGDRVTVEDVFVDQLPVPQELLGLVRLRNRQKVYAQAAARRS